MHPDFDPDSVATPPADEFGDADEQDAYDAAD